MRAKTARRACVSSRAAALPPNGRGRRNTSMRSTRFSPNNRRPHVRLQSRWNRDRSVALLVVFHDREQRTSDRQPRTVERVHEFEFGFGIAAKAKPPAPRLEIRAVRTGAYLAIASGAGQPHFQIVRLCRVEAD